MRTRSLGSAAVLAAALTAAQAVAQVYATPLPPGPGSVTLPLPGGPMVAPVLLPVGAPTAPPVAVYQYPGSVQAEPSAISGWGVSGGCANGSCGPRWYGSADFLYAAAQGTSLPPLVTVAPAGAVVPPAGRLFTPAPVLFGGEGREGNSFRPGFKLNFGYLWGDGSNGIDAGFFFLGGLSERFIGLTTPAGQLARPFIDAAPAGGGPAPVQSALRVDGLTASLDTFTAGADVNWRHNWLRDCNNRIDLLLGYRYAHLGDSVDVWSATTVAPGASLLTHDSVRTRNNFHGPQVGFDGKFMMNARFTLGLTAKLAMGATVADANSDGVSTATGIVGPVGPGLLVQPTNTVADRTSYFAVIPEAGLRVGYQVIDGLNVGFGYSFLYWSQVRRAGDQLDLTANGAGRPIFPSRTGDYWVQGWTAGLEWKY